MISLRNFRLIITILFCAIFSQLNAQEKNLETSSESLKPLQTVSHEESMSYTDAFVLGLVEGITDFLPISSTGHLILANRFLDLDSENPVSNSNGEAIISRKSDEMGNPKAYTMKDAVAAYAIIIQIAAIAAVAFIYWRDVLSMILGIFGKSREGLLLARNLFAAFLPAAAIGFLLHDKIEEYLFGVAPVIFALSMGAFAMIFIQKKYQKSFDENSPAPELYSLTIKQSLAVGFLQCVALWPGTSRSMMTIMGAYIVGLRPVQAAKFSFLLGLITLSAASCYKILKDGKQMSEALSTGPLILGLVVAFVSSAIAAKWLVGFLSRKGLVPFAWYRLILATALIVFFYIWK